MRGKTMQLDIFPAFLPECHFQLDAQASSLRFERHYARHSDDGPFVETMSLSEAESAGIWAMADAVVTEARPDKRLILDGVSLCCTLSEDGSSRSHKFRCPEDGTDELELVLRLMELAEGRLTGEILVNYHELLESYFFGRMKVKVYAEENPYRLRIYGHLSIDWFEEFRQVIEEAATHSALLIDMRNFESMGKLMQACFAPLHQVADLKFLANPRALAHLEEMGFHARKIVVIDYDGSGVRTSLEEAESWAEIRKVNASINRQLKFWFFKYHQKSEHDFNGSEAFTLFEKLNLLERAYFTRVAQIPDWEEPILVLRISERSFILTTEHRFVYVDENSIATKLFYIHFAGHQGFLSPLIESRDGSLAAVKSEGLLADFGVKTTHGTELIWKIPTGFPGFAFWNVTKKCVLIGKKIKAKLW